MHPRRHRSPHRHRSLRDAQSSGQDAGTGARRGGNAGQYLPGTGGEEQFAHGAYRGHPTAGIAGIKVVTEQGAVPGFPHDAFSVSELSGLAIEAAGSGEHHLRAVQQPVSLVMARPIALALDGRGPLVLARAAGLITFGSSPLHGGEPPGLVTPELAEFIRPGASPGTACLLAAASCPSLEVVLLSAGTAPHWAAAKATTAAPLDPGHLRKVTDVLAQG